MMSEPESTRTIDICCTWYYSTLEARDMDYMNGIPKKLTWDDIKSLIEYKPCPIPTRELAAISFVIDSEYISHLYKNREDANK